MARDFNGTTQALELAAALVTAPAFSFAAWVRPDQITTEDHIVSVCDFDAVSIHSLFLDPTPTNGMLGAGSYDSGWAIANSTNVMSASTWHHACGIWTSTTARRAVLDGDWANSGTNTTSKVPSAIDVSRIGCQAFSSGNDNFFDGRIAEVGVWNVALTEGEVRMLAAGVSPIHIRTGSLIAYIPILGSSPETDYSGQGNPFTLANAPAIADHAPVAPMFGFDLGWQGAFTAAAAGGRIMGSLAGHGGLAGAGGLAGKRGGLAG